MEPERGGLMKTRAESFARHLQVRLRSLGENEPWMAEDEVYHDIDSSLASPEEELSEPHFSLQRESSSDSQYFDSVEDIEDLSPVDSKTPNFHERTDSEPIPIVNGRCSMRGCSINDVDLTTECELDVPRTCGGKEGDFEKDFCFIYTPDLKETPRLDDADCKLTVAKEGSFSVASGIEQNISYVSADRLAEEKLDPQGQINGQCEDTIFDHKTVQLSSIATTSNHAPVSSTPESDKNVSLSDLLKALKQDIAKGRENTEISEPACPYIHVHESSPLRNTESTETDDSSESDIEVRRRSFQRSSSLKSGKTPPGTPGGKKIVRFADALGLDLADTKTFSDEVPTVPKSAYEDLDGFELSTSPVVDSLLSKRPSQRCQRTLVPLFQQPGVQPNFLDRVRVNNVCLESAYVTDPSFFAISGVVRIKNIDFHKSVYVRYSLDRWRTFSDMQARYVPNSCDGFSDKFSFVLYAHTLLPGQRVEFAVRYHVAGAQYWDNNACVNYVFECINQLPPDPGLPSSADDSWSAFY